MPRVVTILAVCLCSVLPCSARAAGEERPAVPAPGKIAARAAYAAKKERSDTLRNDIKRQIDLSIELDRASRLINEKRCEEAIPVLERICADYPRINAAAELLAGCYLRTGRPLDAANLLEERLRTDAGNDSFMRDLGLAYLDLGRKEKAIEVWERMLGDDEKHASVFGTVAQLEQDAGLYEEALRTYRRGRRFERHFLRYTKEIMRLERLLERPDAAFREGLAYLGAMREPRIEHARFLSDIFRDAGAPPSYIAGIDSAAAASKIHARFFALLKALLLVEAARYDDARTFLAGTDSPTFDAHEFYTFLGALAGMDGKAPDESFRDFFDSMLDSFLDRYGESPIAPGVLLIAAQYRWGEVRRKGAPDSARVREVVELMDRAIAHPHAAAYAERAIFAKAVVLLEGLRSPELALLALDRMQWRGREQRYKVEELRVRALLASGDWQRVKGHLDLLVVNPDSAIAVLARYGLGMLAFYERNYSESIEILSGLAEKHPASTWANDALETAMTTKAALNEGNGAIDPYRAALFAGGRGEFAAAIDSLAVLEKRHPDTVLGPRALFLRAEFEESAGRPARAVDAFARLADTYPLHELAPRALERIGLLLEQEQPEEAEKRFKQIMTRYPDDPFLERVRMRYMALRKSTGAGEE